MKSVRWLVLLLCLFRTPLFAAGEKQKGSLPGDHQQGEEVEPDSKNSDVKKEAGPDAKKPDKSEEKKPDAHGQGEGEAQKGEEESGSGHAGSKPGETKEEGTHGSAGDKAGDKAEEEKSASDTNNGEASTPHKEDSAHKSELKESKGQGLIWFLVAVVVLILGVFMFT